MQPHRLRNTDWELYRYRNNVKGDFQGQPPPPFRGGILADQMGLGKTLQMIALIASDAGKMTPESGGPEAPVQISTLVIVPFPRMCFRHLHACNIDLL